MRNHHRFLKPKPIPTTNLSLRARSLANTRVRITKINTRTNTRCPNTVYHTINNTPQGNTSPPNQAGPVTTEVEIRMDRFLE